MIVTVFIVDGMVDQVRGPFKDGKGAENSLTRLGWRRNKLYQWRVGRKGYRAHVVSVRSPRW
jgi:hypothetical protein